MPRRTPSFRLTATPLPAATPKAAGYGAQWRKLRLDVLAAEPLCRACAAQKLVTPAVQVDHIRPRALGGGDERTNLQPLCLPCHQEKTRRDVARMPKNR